MCVVEEMCVCVCVCVSVSVCVCLLKQTLSGETCKAA